MITTDQCLAQLTALADVTTDDALSQARGYLEVYAPLVHADRIRGVRLLADLKGRFARSVEPSLLRSDILDMIDARSARLSDSDDDLTD